MRFQVNNAERVRIDASGLVGIGTASPEAQFHLQETSVSPSYSLTGRAVALFERNADMSIVLRSNDTSDSSIDFADSSAQAPARIVYEHNTNNMNFNVNGSERMRIDSSGHFLINCTAAQGVGGYTLQKGTGGVNVQQNSDSTSGGYEFYVFRRNSTQIGSINQSSTNAVTYNTSSDARLKDVTGSARGLDVINNLNPVAYNWKSDNHADEGLIAQEVEELVPNAVNQDEDGFYSMDYSKLVTHLVKGMQEQQEQIESLKSEIAKLNGE